MRTIPDFKLSSCADCCILLLGNSPPSEIYIPTFRNTLFPLHRRIGVEWLCLRNVGVFLGKKLGSKMAWASRKESDRLGVGLVTEQVVESGEMRIVLLWVIIQQIVVISYRSFGTRFRPTFSGNLRMGLDRLSRNVGTILPLLAAWKPRRAQFSRCVLSVWAYLQNNLRIHRGPSVIQVNAVLTWFVTHHNFIQTVYTYTSYFAIYTYLHLRLSYKFTPYYIIYLASG
jgi:hypothetical protein